MEPSGRRRAGGIVTALGAAMLLTGVVVPGTECPGLQLDDGRISALSRLPATLNTPGTRVTVSGPGYAGSATCQQEVFVVETAQPAG
jgi:hypothetical protein